MFKIIVITTVISTLFVSRRNERAKVEQREKFDFNFEIKKILILFI